MTSSFPKKICVFTGTRAEYGLLRSLMGKIASRPVFMLQLLVTGAHLSAEFGYTCSEIEGDGFLIDEKVDILSGSDTPSDVSRSMGQGLTGFASAFERLEPDLLIVLGDRYEALAAVCAATIGGIPVAHIHGGEVTLGAVDDAFRHAITKMSHIHFTCAEEYRNRVIQLGEYPETVFNVGSPGIDSMRSLDFMSKDELADRLGFSPDNPFFLVTFHPETRSGGMAGMQTKAMLDALDHFSDRYLVFTCPGADAESGIIKKMISDLVLGKKEKTRLFSSMGRRFYLSGMKYAEAVIGNSSSGIIETPFFKVPCVNIGNRQEGRIRAQNIIDTGYSSDSIIKAVQRAVDPDFRSGLENMTDPFDRGNTAEEIIAVLENIQWPVPVAKKFYDIGG